MSIVDESQYNKFLHCTSIFESCANCCALLQGGLGQCQFTIKCVTAVSHVLNEQTVRKIFEFVTYATAKIDHISWILSMKIVFACFFFCK